MSPALRCVYLHSSPRITVAAVPSGEDRAGIISDKKGQKPMMDNSTRGILALVHEALLPFANILDAEDCADDADESAVIGDNEDSILLQGDFVTVGELRKAKYAIDAIEALEARSGQ